MEISIEFPKYSPGEGDTSYKGLKAYLKQLELCVHHAQKVVENAEKDGVNVTEDSYIIFDHPSLLSSLRLEENEELKNVEDNFYEELQNVEIKISLR